MLTSLATSLATTTSYAQHSSYSKVSAFRAVRSLWSPRESKQYLAVKPSDDLLTWETVTSSVDAMTVELCAETCVTKCSSSGRSLLLDYSNYRWAFAADCLIAANFFTYEEQSDESMEMVAFSMTCCSSLLTIRRFEANDLIFLLAF